MKAVMKSVSPQICEKVAKGDCTILVSKTAPKCEVPFKCYIYATKKKHLIAIFKKGEYISIAGPSGCGKSTLLSILGLLDTPTGGRYLLNNRPVEGLKPAERARIRNREIGFIFQAFNLIDEVTFYENAA